jgi:hypothetical protein
MPVRHVSRFFLGSSVRDFPPKPASRLIPRPSLVLSFLCVPVEMHAQESFVSAAADVGGERLLRPDIPSILAASKYKKYKQKVTRALASISIVTAEEIQRGVSELF